MLKRFLTMFTLLGIFVLALVYWTLHRIKEGKAMGAKFAPPPTSVTTIIVEEQSWQPVLSAVGSMKAVNGVTLSTDLAGIVREIAFVSGAAVKRGDVLVKLDTQQEEALLRLAEARLQFAKTDLTRKRDLQATKAISQSDWDLAQSQVSQMQSTFEDAEALVRRKQLTAPFDGVAGIRQINLGQYLQPGASIVTIESLDPIFVEFSIPQKDFERLNPGRKIRVGVDGVTRQTFQGEITAINSRLDEKSRNIMVQGTIKNPDHALRAGMFVNVEVLLPEQDKVVAVPSSAVAYAPYGDSVYVVKSDGPSSLKVEQHFVKLGPKRGDQVTILSGVAAGDQVVSSGVFKLRPNAPVKVDNRVQPNNSLNPTPANT